jgi:hypothetical protein
MKMYYRWSWVWSVCRVVTLVLVLALAGCSEVTEVTDYGDGGIGAGDGLAPCAPGTKAVGKACVPIFDDDCPEDQLPLLGGGCKRVGAETCLSGWGIKAGPDWTCKPIGVRECDRGWGLAAPPEFKCQPIGPRRPTCPANPAEHCGHGLPKSCPAGTIPIVGSSECQPVGDCGGEGPWGAVRTNSGAIYVWGGYSGDASDGTKTRPFKTIKEALAMAHVGAHIIVGDGVYRETVTIDKPLTLEGRCATKVRIEGKGPLPNTRASYSAVGVRASDVVVRGLTVTSTHTGVRIAERHRKVRVERCVVRDCGDIGVVVARSGQVTVADSQLVGNGTANAMAFDGELGFLRSVSDAPKFVTEPWTHAVGVGVSSENGAGSLRVEGSIVRAAEMGVYARGATARVVDSIILNTSSSRAGTFGVGVFASCVYDDTSKQCQLSSNAPLLRVERSLVEGATGYGVYAVGVETQLAGSIVRRVRAVIEPQWVTAAIGVVVPDGAMSRVALVERSIVAEVEGDGLHAMGAHLQLRRTLVRDARPLDGRMFGLGTGTGVVGWKLIGAPLTPRLTLADSAILGCGNGVWMMHGNGDVVRTRVHGGEGGLAVGGGYPLEERFGRTTFGVQDVVVSGTQAGIEVLGAAATIRRVVVEGGPPTTAGYGVFANWGGSLRLADARIEKATLVGLGVFDSDLDAERVVVVDTSPLDHLADGISASGYVVDNDRSVKLTDTVVLRSRGHGISVMDVTATLKRVSVRDTRPNEITQTDGNGVMAWGLRKSLPFVLEDSWIRDCQVTGLLTWGAKATVRRTRLSGVKLGALDLPDKPYEDRLYGVGIVAGALREGHVEGVKGDGQTGTLRLDSCEISAADRAAISSDDAVGSVRRTLFAKIKVGVNFDGQAALLMESNEWRDVGQQTAWGLRLTPPPAALFPN